MIAGLALGPIALAVACFLLTVLRDPETRESVGERPVRRPENTNVSSVDEGSSSYNPRVVEHLQRRLSSAKSRASREAQERSEPGTEDEVRWEDLTEEEQASFHRQAEIMSKVKDVYWKRAPSILAEILTEEIKDDQWSDNLAQKGRQSLETAGLKGSDLVDLECGETLCKVRIEHDGEEALEQFKSLGRVIGPWNGIQQGGTRDLDDEGLRKESFIYFSKHGDRAPFEKMNERMLAYVE